MGREGSSGSPALQSRGTHPAGWRSAAGLGPGRTFCRVGGSPLGRRKGNNRNTFWTHSPEEQPDSEAALLPPAAERVRSRLQPLGPTGGDRTAALSPQAFARI
ncbi:hypothetical protein KIL84_008484 [Mauremys mutica]|uniref:Uncharacterized protein n=1 Tax=Mauremys mutica TaxID=74926 RepID=A0A9D4AXS9_9SAUR|nr:hypothetical protein KIL84_008484 [Mauremys mutica]